MRESLRSPIPRNRGRVLTKPQSRVETQAPEAEIIDSLATGQSLGSAAVTTNKTPLKLTIDAKMQPPASSGVKHHSYMGKRLRSFNAAMFAVPTEAPTQAPPASIPTSPKISTSSPRSSTSHELRRVSSSSTRLSRSSFRSSWSSIRKSFSSSSSTQTSPVSPIHRIPKGLEQYIKPKRDQSPSSVYSRASSNGSVKFLAAPESAPLPLRSTKVPSTAYDDYKPVPLQTRGRRKEGASSAPRREIMSQYECAEADYWATKDEAMKRRRAGSVRSVRSEESVYSRPETSGS